MPTGGEDYHIGKSSFGWKFLFSSYPDEGLVTAQDWREFLKNRLIRNEYNEEMSYEDFWQMVQNKQNDPKAMTLYEHSESHRHGHPSRFETIDPEGYRISTSYDFS